MIELRTGVPGSGKTLSMVQALAKLQERWKTHPDEVRPVFVLGIPDLALVHSVLPTKSVLIGRGLAPQIVPDLEAIPDGSLILIDEAQGCYPPRSSAMAPPEHVAELNTHRHRGLDMWITTQHPKLIDHSLRALVGKHMHYRRLFGGMRAMVYEWDACSDGLGGMKNAVTSYWSYPKKVFNWYKSAEIHTKQKFKLPLWIWLPFISIGLSLYFMPKTFDLIFGEKKKPAVEASKPVKNSSPDPAKEKSKPVEPQQVAEVKAVEAKPEFVGCMASKDKCSCVTPEGVSVPEPPMCRESANGFGYLIKISMAPQGSQHSYSVPVAPDSVKADAPAQVSSLSADGYGVLGGAPPGVRKPGQ
ncbi:Zonular occludens toxin (Zot) [compost metagenome]